MGIDIGYYNAEDDDMEESERVSNVEGFFHVAEVLTRLLDIMDEHKVPRHLDIPDAQKFLSAFEAYTTENPEEYEDRFARYCDFVCESHKVVQKQLGEGVQPVLGSLIQPQAEEFRPEVRIFLGRCLLNPEPVGAEEAEKMLYALVYLAMVIARFVAHFKGEDPDAVKILEGVKDTLALISRYCEGCMEQNRQMIVSF